MCLWMSGCKSEEPAPTEPPKLCAGCGAPPVRVWAAGRGVPGKYLTASAVVPPGNELKGQTGWDLTFEFFDGNDLVSKLDGGFKLPKFFDEKERPFAESEITKLAIHAHGGSGGVDINNAAINYNLLKNDDNALNATTLKKAEYQESFKKILRVLAPNADLYFMCCLTGLGADGKFFLEEASRQLASKNVRVIAYVSTLATSNQMLHFPSSSPFDNEKTYYAGCRETAEDSPGKKGAMELDGAGWLDLKNHPWADETTLRARTARNGVIIKEGIDSLLPANLHMPEDEKPKSDPPPSAPPSSGSKPKSSGRRQQGSPIGK